MSYDILTHKMVQNLTVELSTLQNGVKVLPYVSVR